MSRILTVVIAMSFMILFQGFAYSQDMRAKAENGREVLLKSNGTWEYADAAKPASPAGAFVKSEKATTSFTAKSGKVAVWFDPAKWSAKKSEDPNKANFANSEGDLYAVLIAERIGMSIEGLKEMALKNARNAAPDAEKIYEQNREVNGRNILCMQIKGTVEGIQFVYYSYYYAGKAGTVQLITYTSDNLFAESEAAMTEFLNGLVITE